MFVRLVSIPAQELIVLLTKKSTPVNDWDDLAVVFLNLHGDDCNGTDDTGKL